ncbi:beta/gamma crystallin-related protein [Phenylobacterium sp.]|jgi:hypothetical protein|uniref:beta/gamma crystallin-related protein n=1 Tax=Phenylobacterium sp. TaxID=1871053 RepID=UPI0037C524F3
MTFRTLITAALLAAISASPLAAQPYRGGGATLYELPDFKGRSVTITGPEDDLGRWRFNDRAQSARFEGRWRICEHDNMKGRCAEVSGGVPDLTAFGLFGQMSSLSPVGYRPDRPDRPYGGGGGFRPGDARGVEGVRTVFFPRPSVNGVDVAAGDRGADTFCRSQGLGRAVWYDSSERAREAIGPDGEYVGRSSVLRDLLCRRY